jgi:hypothetical protein
VLGLLYGPADSFYFLASDIESAMDWCEEQCRKNKILQAVQQASKGESGKGGMQGVGGLLPSCLCLCVCMFLYVLVRVWFCVC